MILYCYQFTYWLKGNKKYNLMIGLFYRSGRSCTVKDTLLVRPPKLSLRTEASAKVLSKVEEG
ncbi:MAG TPA: hypothetical protein DCY25_00185 [Bacteroidales bacterium]|nr:hypothetical protein [Bacteroidales bacterium]